MKSYWQLEVGAGCGSFIELDSSVLIYLGVCKTGHLEIRVDAVHIFDKKLGKIDKKFLKRSSTPTLHMVHPQEVAR